uniref:DENN domain containing 11 n=1 Tax=Chinchilla lanigera TaxID=34839 RepID=A0A8C2UID0_CHILA
LGIWLSGTAPAWQVQGNMVEWCLPQDIDLEGVEFKSMASGSHKIQSDFIYFRKGPFFGLACFANMPVESELERGARMKSVGILSPSYTLLYRYMHFLENQVRHQLETPGHYSHLAAFYEDKKGVLHVGPGRGSSL